MGNNQEKHRNKVQQAESAVLSYYRIRSFQSYLSPDVKIMDVEIETQFGKQFIHTYLSGSNHQKTIVLIHGFGGSSLVMVKMLKHLVCKFKVYCIDLPGMGLSYRQKFQLKNHRDVIDYFVQAIEQWRKALKIDKFILAGHSFGGYISGVYHEKYPQYLEQLILISPLGMVEGSEKENSMQLERRKKGMSFIQKLFFGKILSFIQDRVSLSKIFQKFYIPTRFLLGKYLKNRMKMKNQIEISIWKQYYSGLLGFSESSENALYQLFYFPSQISQISLYTLFSQFQNNNKVSIDFYYGDSDWMPYNNAQQLVNSQTITGTFNFIDESGHNIPVQNPEDLCRSIISKCFETEKQVLI